MSPLRRAAATGVAGVLLMLAACTSPSGDAGSPTSPATGDSPSRPAEARSGTTEAVPVPPPPGRKACYRLGFKELAKLSNDSAPVPCRDTHNAQTIFVGELDTVVDGHAVAVDSAAVREQLSTTCPRKLAAYVGGNRSTRELSRFRVLWFSPSLEQSDLGADWFRCDVIAFEARETLADLPPRRQLAGVLDDPDALDTYGLCGTAAPGAAGFERVICSRPHSWRAISTISIDGGKRYPGTKVVRAAGDVTCKTRVREISDSSLKFRYGWEWPTKDQWQHGQRYGYCWAPD